MAIMKMDKTATISIIIPAYNAEKTIERTLESIRGQSYSDYEVLLINDGSSDRTEEIVKALMAEDSRIKYFQQENQGVSNARNRGIAESQGQYLCFMDADDTYEARFLEKTYNKIKSADSDLVYCGSNIIKNGEKRSLKTEFKSGDILLDHLLDKIKTHTSVWLVKKEFLVKKGTLFIEGVTWGEDTEFFTELLALTDKVCFVDEYLTNYNIEHSPQQLSAFSLNKIDKGYEMIMRLANNPRVNKNIKIEKALMDYILHGFIIYLLLEGLDRGEDLSQLKKYYDKYERYIKKWTFNNGIRSIKINVRRVMLMARIRLN